MLTRSASQLTTRLAVNARKVSTEMEPWLVYPTDLLRKTTVRDIALVIKGQSKQYRYFVDICRKALQNV